MAAAAGAMDVDYELSQQLQGHESQVRCVAVLSEQMLVSGGLDSQVIMWKRPRMEHGLGPFELHKKLGHHSDFVYALAPSHSSAGAFYSGSKDRTAVRVDKEGNPVMQYVGHEGPVCSVVERGQQLITGAWDGTAKVWDTATGELKHSLDAGSHAVTVAVLPTGEIVTGSQDRSLRVFRGAECITTVKEAHGDIIRGISASSAHVVTCSNDNCLKVWSFDGCEMGKLAGHASFVYGVAHSADGKTVLSSSDDCTLKLWSLSDSQIRQSVIHAGTVWQAAPLPDGDVATACADMLVRVWTTAPDRMAPEAERQTQKEMAEQAALEAAGKGSSSTPMADAADISTMPSTVGKKNGEIKCFKDGATTFAFSWNAGARQWDKIGEVVGQESQKKHYPGDLIFPAGEYDFIFDVEMGAGGATTRLPYNKGQNPMVVAESFCTREQINKGNIEQVRTFIIQNAGGEAACAAPTPAAASGPVSENFPVMTPAVFKEGKFDPMLKKIVEFNDQVEGEAKMDANEVGFLTDAIGRLKVSITSAQFRPCEKELIYVKLKTWPADKLLPIMDLWRLMLANPESSDLFKGSDRGAAWLTQVVTLLSGDPSGGLGLCCARYLANLSIFQTNRYAVFDKRELVLGKIEPVLASTTNKHTKVALTSVLLNFAVVLHETSSPPKPWDAGCGGTVARLALAFLEKATPDDGDAAHRALLGIGTLLPRDAQNGSGVKAQCKAAGLEYKLGALESKAGAQVISELRAFLA